MATQTSGIGLDSCLSKAKIQVIDIDLPHYYLAAGGYHIFLTASFVTDEGNNFMINYDKYSTIPPDATYDGGQGWYWGGSYWANMLDDMYFKLWGYPE